MKSSSETSDTHTESDDDKGQETTSPDLKATQGQGSGNSGGGAAEDGPAEAVVDEGDGEAEAAADDGGDEEGPATGRPRGRTATRWIAAAVLVAVLAVAGYEGWLLFQHHQKDVASAEALDAAEKFAITLTTIDPNAIDTNITGVIDGSTGEFKDLYQQSSGALRQVLIDNKATANGMVLDAAVKSAKKNRVEVVLFIDQVVSNAAAPAPQLDRSRVVMTMEKVDGRWLASKVDLP